ncbi:DNA repair protein rad14 [Fusarium oxysporum f. sp. albedinis]|nr:DNA repair protein rad14 [Fusarium oxysporum f. sp. albedinis]
MVVASKDMNRLAVVSCQSGGLRSASQDIQVFLGYLDEDRHKDQRNLAGDRNASSAILIFRLTRYSLPHRSLSFFLQVSRGIKRERYTMVITEDILTISFVHLAAHAPTPHERAASLRVLKGGMLFGPIVRKATVFHGFVQFLRRPVQSRAPAMQVSFVLRRLL